MTTFKRHNGTNWEYIGLPNNVGMSPQTLGYAQVVANQAGIPTSFTDLTGLSVTVTVPEGRRIRITGQVAFFNATAVSERANLGIFEGATELNRVVTTLTAAAATNTGGTPVSAVITPTAGTHTYKLAAAVAGSGTMTMGASATFPAFILVEDITGSTLPYQPASVPVGTLGYAIKTSSQAGITAEVAVTDLIVNIAVPAGRRIKVSALCHILNSNADSGTQVRIKQDGVEVQFDDETTPVAGTRFDLNPSIVLSPSAGAHTYTVTAALSTGAGTTTVSGFAADPSYLLVEDITPTPASGTGAPGSTLGYAEVIANQGSITTEVDLTGLAVTVSVPAGRRIRITGSTWPTNTAADSSTRLLIKEGATVLQTRDGNIAAASSAQELNATVVITPTAGMHTYKLAMNEQTGAGTVTNNASVTFPSYILVEDITGAVWPTGEPVTTGLFASEAWTPFVPSITQSVAVTATVLTARYIKLGRIVHVYARLNVTSGGTSGQPVLITLPVPGFAHGGNGIPVGSGWIYDASTVTMFTGSYNILGSGLTVDLVTDATAGNDWGVVPAIALASGDQISFNLTYEAAS